MSFCFVDRMHGETRLALQIERGHHIRHQRREGQNTRLLLYRRLADLSQHLQVLHRLILDSSLFDQAIVRLLSFELYLLDCLVQSDKFVPIVLLEVVYLPLLLLDDLDHLGYVDILIKLKVFLLRLKML